MFFYLADGAEISDSSFTFSSNLNEREFLFKGLGSNFKIDSVFIDDFPLDPDTITPTISGSEAKFLLSLGKKTILTVKSGQVTQTITVLRILPEDIVEFPDPPEIFAADPVDGAVLLKVTRETYKRTESSYIYGYNFYAAKESGGVASGYIKLNSTPVKTPTLSEEVIPFYQKEAFNLPSTTITSLPSSFYIGIGDNGTASYYKDSFNTPASLQTLVSNISFSTIKFIRAFEFAHSRVGSTFAAVSTLDPLYYVATSVVYNPMTKQEFESPYSLEVPCRPISLKNQTVSVPLVSQEQIIQSLVKSFNSVRPDIAIHPGSVLRDLVLDPVSFELERIKFIQDFFYKATAFSTLLGVDGDENYLRALQDALFLSTLDKTQTVINMAFEKLASNFGTSRLSGIRSRGQLVFYTTLTPDTSLFIPVGTVVTNGTLQFKTLEEGLIDSTRLSTFFNPTTGRYLVRVLAEALDAGLASNVGPYQITRLVTSIPGLSVTNEAAFFGGSDTETNRELAARCSRILGSVDSGTAAGYKQTLAASAGVLDAYIVGPGNPIMFRDYSSALGKHLGGKVDIWVQGSQTSEVTESFAIDYLTLYNEPFEIYENAQDLKFILKDTTKQKDLVRILNYSSDKFKLGLKIGYSATGNVSTFNQYFDLTDSTLEAGVLTLTQNTINEPLSRQLVYSTPIYGDIQLKVPRKYIFKSYQPVADILELRIDTENGPVLLDSSTYNLVKTDSPFLEGRSVKANNYLEVYNEGTDSTVDGYFNTLLTGSDTVIFTNADQPEYLSKYGIIEDSISISGYVLGTHYKIISGSNNSLTGIQIISNPSNPLKSGSTVNVYYKYRPNLSVKYTTNLIVSSAQKAVDSRKHVGADVLVKEAYSVPVNMSAVVTLKRGFKPDQVERSLRANLQKFFNQLRLGQPVRQSDLIALIDDTSGVSYVTVPLLKFSRAGGSFILREPIVGGFEYFPSTSSTFDIWVYRGLKYVPTVQDVVNYNIVELDGSAMTIKYGYTDLDGPYQAYYQNTLNSYGDSSNLILTLPKNDDVKNHEVYASYTILSGDKVQNIEVEDIEYCTLGTVEFKFGEDA
jgi:hypothetical protein